MLRSGKKKPGRIKEHKRIRKYGQTRLKPSKRGALSCVIAGAEMITIVLLVGITYMLKGKAAGIIGGLGISAVVFGVVGIVMAAKGFKEREKDYRNCKVGLVLNILILMGLFTFFLGGLM